MKCLIISDLTTTGNIAINGIRSLLMHDHHEVYCVPTVLLSNTLDYKTVNSIDCTQFLKETLMTYEKQHIEFDWVIIGYLNNFEQVEIVKKYIIQHKCHVLMDPIMADNGKYYHGKGNEHCEMFKSLMKYCDIMVPNYTEYCLLFDKEYESYLLDFKNISCDLVITSVKMDGCFVVGYDHIRNCSYKVPYKEYPVRFGGSGDIFIGLLMKEIFKGKSLEMALEMAVKHMNLIIVKNLEDHPDIPSDHSKSLYIEPYLHLLDESEEL